MRKLPFVQASLGLAAFAFLAFVSSGSAIAQTAPPQRAEVLILGTYHMANPGHDVFNMKADDVLSPKRQAEIGEMVKQQDAYLHSHTVLETLLDMNDGSPRTSASTSAKLARENRATMPGRTSWPVGTSGTSVFTTTSPGSSNLRMNACW